MPKSDAENQGYWLYRNVESMAQKVGAAPVFVDQDLSKLPGSSQSPANKTEHSSAFGDMTGQVDTHMTGQVDTHTHT